MQAKLLIDCARALGYSDAELHRRLGMSNRSYLGDVYAGHKQLSPEMAVLLAELCGGPWEPKEVAARQLVENAKEPRRSMLERALFTFGGRGVAFAGRGTPTEIDARATADDQTTDAELEGFTLYTLSRVLKALALLLMPDRARATVARSVTRGLRAPCAGARALAGSAC